MRNPLRNDNPNDLDRSFREFAEQEERRQTLCSPDAYDWFCHEDMKVMIERAPYLRRMLGDTNYERNIQFAARRILGDL